MEFKHPLKDMGKRIVRGAMQESHITVCAGTIVNYSLLSSERPTGVFQHLFNQTEAYDKIDRKIRGIFLDNPDADLKRLERALGISIIDIQRAPKPPKPPPELSDDVVFGEIDPTLEPPEQE